MPDEQPQTNGIDTETFINVVRRIEDLQAEIDIMMQRAREEADPVRQDIAAVKREAVDQGIGKRELAAVLKRRRLEGQAARADEHLDLEQKANFEAMIAALERTAEQMGPLGQAALDQARAGL